MEDKRKNGDPLERPALTARLRSHISREQRWHRYKRFILMSVVKGMASGLGVLLVTYVAGLFH